ncbi:ankyrin repeats 3 copies domain-containing [Trichoderma cornu-damae]|uniref:Ankyrin repeats 3 copies domain-containing n=1 Tax=Trichoderma cornu-damae TaxID=654480 RepID=A0A9P8QKR4_9HYPO|nr:ankyrin repeats 3 copies domain-containing [Trichoderma cornu-damae]
MVLDKIPTEILVHIGRSITSEKDLGALVLTSRHMYQNLNAVLYDLNLRRGDVQNSCVTWAALNNSIATIKRARSYGANLDVYDVATEPRLREDWLVKHNGASRRVVPPLHLTVFNGFHHITEYLLDNGATIDMPSIGLCSCRSASFRPPQPAWFPLHSALCHGIEGHVSAEMLIRRGARKEASGCPGLGYRTVTRQPSLSRLVAGLGYLGENNRDNEGWPPLHLASRDGMDEVVAAILELTDTDVMSVVPDMNLSALHCSVAQRNVNTTRMLLEAPGAHVQAVDSGQRTILYSAARGANDGSAAVIISLLVAAGADVDQADENGVTPLYAAASRRFHCDYPNFMAVEALLSHGANPFTYTADHDGMSIFHQLLGPCPSLREVVRSRRAVLLRLVELGVDFDTRCRIGQNIVEAHLESDGTPLFFAAAIARDLECTEILLRAGANPNSSVLERRRGHQEQSILYGLFRHMWDNTYQSAPPLSHAGPIIVLLLRHGSSLESINGEECALGYACRRQRDGVDYTLLDFLLQHATGRNISLEYLESLIAENERQYGRCHREVFADHYDVVRQKLVNFKQRAFGQVTLWQE